MDIDIGLPSSGTVDVREQARAAEEAGYRAGWASEIRHDPLLQLTAAATATSTLQLGTSIAVAFARTPMTLAVAANDVQALSGGRLLLGLGSQVKAHITRRFGMPWSSPAPRMREFVLALRAIWVAWSQDAPLEFDGEFYRHTLMTPFFNPGANPWDNPPVLLAGVGELMTEVAGEVADGFLAHGFTTERYLREATLPALRRGRARAGGALEGFTISGSPLVVTGRDEREMAAADAGVRAQIAFYASTPAYRPVLDLHGWGGLGDELHRMSRQNRWGEMAGLVDDEVLDAFAVVGEPERIAPELLRRFGDVMTRATLYTPYTIDPGLLDRLAGDVRSAATTG